MAVIIYTAIIVVALLGAPIFIVMSAFALVAFHYADLAVSGIAVDIYKIANQPVLLAIPLFTFGGYIMAESQMPKRLLRLAEQALGWMPGGIAIVSLIICAFFTAFTGASGVTIIALGGLLLPILSERGYSERFSLGLITTSGSLGLLFPPSLPIILYGLVSNTLIDQIFLGGIIPGILLIIVLSLPSIKAAITQPKPSRDDKAAFSWQKLRLALWDAKYELPLPVIILVGIYGGYTTASEAAAILAGYVVVVECFIYRDVSITEDLPRIIKECMTLVGAILLILCCALGLTNYLVDAEVPMRMLGFIQGHIENKYVFLIYLNIFLLLVGCLMDIFSAIIVVVPLILPIALSYDVHPVHMAIIFLANLEIGYITPPVGLNLFISSFRFNKPVVYLYRAVLPFFFLMLLALLVITYFPLLTLIWF